MDQIESTTANADLWSRYFADQWGRWLNPLGEPSPITEIAQGTGAQVAGFLSMLAAGPIAWLYNANTANVADDAARTYDDATHNSKVPGYTIAI